MLKIQHVSKAFDGVPVLQDISFELARGERVGVVGPSGGGKSVLLKILGQILEPDSGSVEIVESASEGAALSSRSVGFLFQEGALFDSLSVIENVAFPLLVERDFIQSSSEPGRRTGRLHQEMTRGEALERAHVALGKVGLGDAWKKSPGELSGGMRRRVGIARALVSDPELLLFDDPTGGLDPVAATVIMELILRLQETYQPAILIVSHDIRRLLPSVDRIIGLFDSRVQCDCPARRVQIEAPEKVVRFLATRFDFKSWEAHP